MSEYYMMCLILFVIDVLHTVRKGALSVMEGGLVLGPATLAVPPPSPDR